MANRQGKKPKPVTPERLHEAAIAYMGRFSTTAENLRRVLLRRVAKDQDLEPETKTALKLHIDTLIEKYQVMGYLNDTAYVEGKVASLRRAGTSTRAITQKLRFKGASAEDIETVLAADDDPEINSNAAWIFARRKKTGPLPCRGNAARFAAERYGGNGPRRLRLPDRPFGDRCAA